MFLDLDREHLCLLERLVESRLAELQVEVRRTRNFEFLRELESEQGQLEQILHQLHECECDVMA
jgi:hypothetical protein